MAELDSGPTEAPSSPPAPAPPTPPAGKAAPLLSKGLALAAILMLLGFCGVQGSMLLREYLQLQRELRLARASTVVGYENINPNPMYAQRPNNWFHHKDETTFLWAGWRDGEHLWFKLPQGQLNPDDISQPLGRDSIQAIDFPVIELGGGVRWERIPDEAPVTGISLGGVDTVYPMRVLEKVEVINDTIGGTPYLVAYMPRFRSTPIVAVFEASIGNERIKMGLSGYFAKKVGIPILYDRGTESLWLPEEDGVKAIAGKHRGAVLKRVAPLVSVNWGDWRSAHPKSRLIVGAERDKREPAGNGL